MKKSLSLLVLLTSATILSYGQANTSLSNLSSTTAINHSLYPIDNNARDLGSVDKSWKSIYLENAIYLKDALFMHSTGSNNAFVGFQAGKSITSGVQNAAFGYNALPVNTTGSQNTALGKAVLYQNTNGSFNSGSGYQALFSNTSGNYNTASGAYSLYFNITGSQNTAMGYNALRGNKTNVLNSAFGESALYSNQGDYNTAAGNQSLYANTTGSYNTGIGVFALKANTTGGGNTAIGHNAYFTATNLSNTTCIGYNSGGIVNASNRIEVGNTSVTWIGGEVGWSTYSDGRVKENVKQNIPGLIFINKLQPVSYNYNIHKQNEMLYKGKKDQADWSSKYDIEKQRFTGFIAQDVEKAANGLKYEFSGVVKPSGENDLYSLRYSDFVVPLVKAVQELSSQNDSLKQNNLAINDKLTALLTKVNQMEAAMNLYYSSLSNNKSSEIQMDQNFPNPFSTDTNIKYNIPTHFKSAQLVVADANGTVVKQVALSSAGKGTVNVKAYNLSNGMYTYSLVVDGSPISSKKMIVGK